MGRYFDCINKPLDQLSIWLFQVTHLNCPIQCKKNTNEEHSFGQFSPKVSIPNFPIENSGYLLLTVHLFKRNHRDIKTSFLKPGIGSRSYTGKTSKIVLKPNGEIKDITFRDGLTSYIINFSIKITPSIIILNAGRNSD